METDAPNPGAPGLILVLRPGALGDTLVTLDALAALRLAHPTATIEFVGNAPVAALLHESGVIDRVTSFDDLAVTNLFVDPPRLAPRWAHGTIAVLWLNQTSGIAPVFEAAGYRVAAASPEPAQHAVHVSDHLQDTLLAAGIIPAHRPGVALLRSPSPDAATGTDQLIVHPGSGSPRKNWSPELFATVVTEAQRWGLQPVILSGPADVTATDALQRALPSPLSVVSPPTLSTLARALLRARALLANDSGVAHLAARLGVPTASIFGASDPLRWAPRGPSVRVIGSLGRWPSADLVLSALTELLADTPALVRPGDSAGGGPALQQQRHSEERNEDQDGDAVDHAGLHTRSCHPS